MRRILAVAFGILIFLLVASGHCEAEESEGTRAADLPENVSLSPENDWVWVWNNSGDWKVKLSTLFTVDPTLNIIKAHPGAADYILATTGPSTFGWSNTIPLRLSDNQPQFKHQDAAAYLWFDLSSIAATKTFRFQPVAADSYVWSPTFLGNNSMIFGTDFQDGKLCTYSLETGFTCAAAIPSTATLDGVSNPAAAKTFSLHDNTASALKFNSVGKASIFEIDTTDGAERVAMNKTYTGNGTDGQTVSETGETTYAGEGKPWKSIHVPAVQFKPDGANCGTVTSGQINSGPNAYYSTCSDAAGKIEFNLAMPEQWDGGEVYVEPYVFSTQATPAGIIRFDASVMARGHDELINNSWIASQPILFSDADSPGTTVDTQYKSFRSRNLTAIAAAGSPGDALFVKLQRDNADGSSQAINVYGAKVYYRIDKDSGLSALESGSGVSCTSCTSGLVLASYFENNDNLELPTTEICGCSTNADKTWDITAATYSAQNNGPGSYSLSFNSHSQVATLPADVDTDEGTMVFDLKLDTYGQWTDYAGFIVNNSNYIGCYNSAPTTFRCQYVGSGTSKGVASTLSADSTWHTVRYSWRKTGTPNLSLSIDGGSPITLTDTLGTFSGTGTFKLNYTTLTNDAVYQIDNLIIYDYWNP